MNREDTGRAARPARQLIDTPMGRIAVSMTGDCTATEPLVFWPSLLMDHTLWADQVAYFAERGVPTIAIDPPGHGRSDALTRHFELEECADVLEAILDEAGAPRAHLVGNSWGAMTSAVFGATKPERTASLVLITGTAGTASVYQRWQFEVMLAVTKAAEGVPSLLNGQLTRIFFAPNIRTRNPAAVQRMLAQVAQCDPVSIGYAARSVVIRRRDRHTLYRGISAPTLVISGQHDSIFPPRDGMKLANAIPRSRFVVIPDAAHLLAAEVPDTINTLIDEHLRGAIQHG